MDDGGRVVPLLVSVAAELGRALAGDQQSLLTARLAGLVQAAASLRPSALADRRDAELTADRPRHAHADLAVARHERLRSSLGVTPSLVAAATSAGYGLRSVGAQPALELCPLHGRLRDRER